MKSTAKKFFLVAFFSLLFLSIPQVTVGMEEKQLEKELKKEERLKGKLGEKSLEALELIKDKIVIYSVLTEKQPFGDLYIEVLRTIEEKKEQPQKKVFDEFGKRISELETKLNTIVVEGKNVNQLKEIERDIQDYSGLTGDTQRYRMLLANISQEIKMLEELHQKELAAEQVLLKLIPIDMMNRLKLCPVRPCFVDLGVKNGLNRQLLQMSMAKQTEARCGGLSLINALWAERYAKSGNKSDLTYLHDANNVKRILNTIGCGNWVDIEKVKAYIESAKNKGYDVSNIDAISSVLVLDKNLAEFLFGEEVATGQELKDKVRKGLSQDFFFHGIIVGDEEAQVEGFGHYFAFVIIKSGNQVQYVVIDSLKIPNHLKPDSYRRRRINYLIDHLETGKAESLIPFTRFQEMVYDIEDEIKTKLGKFEEDRKLLSQEEFIKENINKLMELQEKIEEYKKLTGDPTALQKEQRQIEEMMEF